MRVAMNFKIKCFVVNGKKNQLFEPKNFVVKLVSTDFLTEFITV